ncbi:6-phospho-beta-glucosidase [Micromonospora sp. KC721]|uniref:family 4 glycosyl hydrolase n=1 Tax=Micromonospora sp. KC721 TaxID=2530380 RepID=UPI001050B2E8|nr:6-phospho-beta-glucosidase [Micromonospora sp. KC721]TDB82461.1 6-phospho-beta-glucosidase [Micromonospora sp. KC721]
MKIAVVGGGSTYTPELVDGLARLRSVLPVTELALVDTAADRLGVVGRFAARIFAQHDHPGKVTWTTVADEGLDAADVVLIQLRVGGQRARMSDETFPMECGCVGQETTGAGGLAMALRTVPAVLRVAERAARRAAADAWIIDFTNPVGIVTRALLDAGHRAVGLCNVAIQLQRRCANLLGVAPEKVVLDHIGLNHLTWTRAAFVNDEDRLPELLSAHPHALAAEVGLPAELLTFFGSVPSSYLRYFYFHDAVVEAERGAPTRGAQVAAIEQSLLEIYADPSVSTKPDLLAQRGGAYYSEAAVGLIAALNGNSPGPHVANVRNNGTVPHLPDEAVVEGTCDVDSGGPRLRRIRPLPPEMSGLISHVAGYEELALAAAVHGGRDRVYRALLAHPLVGQHDIADALTDRLVAANADYLAWAR